MLAQIIKFVLHLNSSNKELLKNQYFLLGYQLEKKYRILIARLIYLVKEKEDIYCKDN
jgi:hypothetical protein